MRICFGLRRFSEDLDFALNKPDPDFDWKPYLASLRTELETYGYQLEVSDRSSLSSAGKLLEFHHPLSGPRKTLKIKLEIDTNPPPGAGSVNRYIDFPLVTPVVTHDLPSLFAGKLNAILCRPWAKGRDWFDFLWYISQKTPINYELLASGLAQTGPWKGQVLKLDHPWLTNALHQKILTANWEDQKKDVLRFLREPEKSSLQWWGTEMFLEMLSRINNQ